MLLRDSKRPQNRPTHINIENISKSFTIPTFNLIRTNKHQQVFTIVYKTGFDYIRPLQIKRRKSFGDQQGRIINKNYFIRAPPNFSRSSYRNPFVSVKPWVMTAPATAPKARREHLPHDVTHPRSDHPVFSKLFVPHFNVRAKAGSPMKMNI